MKSLRSPAIALALVAVLVASAGAQYNTKVYTKQGGAEMVVASGGTITVQSGGTLAVAAGASVTLAPGAVTPSAGSMAYNIRTRFTIAQVNAGATVLAAISGKKYRVIDVYMIAVGGAVATCTTVDLLGTQSTSSVKLVANAVAALTQSALLRAGASNSTILADGASFVQNDTNTAITIGKTGGSCATATHVDLQLTYAVES
jgi:hypothetical protein